MSTRTPEQIEAQREEDEGLRRIYFDGSAIGRSARVTFPNGEEITTSIDAAATYAASGYEVLHVEHEITPPQIRTGEEP